MGVVGRPLDADSWGRRVKTGDAPSLSLPLLRQRAMAACRMKRC